MAIPEGELQTEKAESDNRDCHFHIVQMAIPEGELQTEKAESRHVGI